MLAKNYLSFANRHYFLPYLQIKGLVTPSSSKRHFRLSYPELLACTYLVFADANATPQISSFLIVRIHYIHHHEFEKVRTQFFHSLPSPIYFKHLWLWRDLVWCIFFADIFAKECLTSQKNVFRFEEAIILRVLHLVVSLIHMLVITELQ